MPRPRSWTDDDLRRAAAASASMAEVAARLGMHPGGRTNQTLRVHAGRLGITLPNGWYRQRPGKELNR